MNFFRLALTYYLKRPLIIIYFAIVTLIIAVIGYFNPLASLIKAYSKFITSSITDTIVLLSKEIYKINVIPYIALGIVLVSIMLGVLSGLIFSGYFNMIYKSIKKRKALKSDIIDGIQKYFIKIAYAFFEFYLSIFAFITLIPLVLIPAIVISNKAIDNGTTNFFNTDLIMLVTVIVAIFILLFLIVNFSFKIPSILNFEKKAIEKSKKVLSTSYWSVFGVVLAFFAVLGMGTYLIYNINVPLIVTLLNWIFSTIIFSLFSIYIFYGFSTCLQNLKRK